MFLRAAARQTSTFCSSPVNPSVHNIPVKKVQNKNPRNLELLGLEHKRRGWQLHYPPTDYYHRALLTVSNRHMTGSIVHVSGFVVVSASTIEHCIRKHLASTKDATAAFNIGRILAHRTLRVGIENVQEPPDLEQSAARFTAFIEGLRVIGMKFQEAEFIEGPYYFEARGEQHHAETEFVRNRMKLRQGKQEKSITGLIEPPTNPLDRETEFLRNRMKLRYGKQEKSRTDLIEPPAKSLKAVFID